jgi:dipeptidyl aminopeptidase/acylaminoacyl peptidase
MVADRLILIALSLLAASVFPAPVFPAAAAATSMVAAAEPAPPFTVQDLVRLERISEPSVAPDGKRIAYTLRTTDMEANQARTGIWLLDTRKRNAQPVRMTDVAANASSAEWSADGNSLYYLSNRSGSNQVWRVGARIDSSRGEAPRDDAVQVTQLPLDVGSFRVAPKGDRILVSLEVFIDCLDLACTKQRLETVAHSAAHGVLYDKLFARHWDAWSDGRRSQLFGMTLDGAGLATGTPILLSAGIDGDIPGKPFGGREDFALSPDGREVAFSVRALSIGEPWSTNFDIYLVAADGGGMPKNLTADNPAWDGQPAFSPDGSQLAYVAMERAGFEADRFHLVLLNLKSGRKLPLTQNWDRSIGSFAWSPDGKTLIATTDHLGQRPLWAIDAVTGRASAITGDGDVEAFVVGPQQVFYTHSDLGSPADLYSVGFAGGKTRSLTHLNEAVLAHRTMSTYEQFNFAGWNDENVFGYVMKPADFRRDKQYPVALLVHGGPQGSMANLWHWRWNAQTFAGAGYAVVLIDFHGSTGYGQAFTDSISGDWGGKPLEDLKRGLAAAIKQYPWLDGDRVCALGGSYGGYMMNWIAGQWPDRFKCLVSHDGIFDNRSMYYSTEELWFPEWESGGPEYVNPAGYSKHNPIDYVDRWKTPTLVIHGQLDYRVPYQQGLGVYTALQRRGIPSELLYFPDENHWVLKPANSIEWYDTTIGWLNRWTKQ